ncbi:MAG: hypothetical protein V1806_12185 [Pseudomonadota bacterium]
MTRQAIIADLMGCLGAISPAQGFDITPARVVRGIHLASEASEMPALSLYNQRVETVDSTESTCERLIILHLWGAVHAHGGDYAGLDRLAAACVAALGRPDLNPHWQRTTCGRLELYEGGAGDPLGLFDLELTVSYEAPLATL